ncbi:MAG TPA: cbb3-type cytochrome c oxidase subunit I [Acidimicrobiales bacterium]|nr:cbb3-type cytochrome c oxidase subunit I [Acidimicrobiales bacterium]
MTTLDVAPPETGRPGAPTQRSPRRPAWMSQHIGTAVILAVAGYAFGHWMGNIIAGTYVRVGTAQWNDVSIVLGLLFAILGWLLGIGAFNYGFAKMIGREPAYREDPDNWTKYFRYSVEHKTVGMQYLIMVLVFFFTAGLLAMAIRTELLSPTTHIYGPGTYIQIVGEHGTMMMMMASSLILGPLGNWLVPIMIGARRMAFPRIEATSFWCFSAGYFVILSALALGGFPTGWTGYAPLQDQAAAGMDSYLVGFAVVALGMILAGFNILITIVAYRAPGMTWGRVPVFVWSMFTTAALLATATPTLVVGIYFGLLDRSAATTLFINSHGGSSYLWEDLFWFFGHPEVYIMALPGFGIVAEILPVFTRKPLFAYRVAAAGLVGVGLLSYFVWQHHLFQSGINPDMRPLFMLTTELISIPTGFVFLVALGTLYKAKMRFEPPMLFSLAMYFNFLIGGITGVFLSDVPVDVTVHGSFFSMAHFHYTILGGLVFAFFAGVYYWTPKLTGKTLNRKLAVAHFWTMFIFFNLTFFPLFIIGLLDQPRRVFEYATRLTALNDWVSISAFCLGGSFIIFIVNFVWSIWIDPKRAPANPWDSKGLEWQTPTPVPSYNFARIPVVYADPYHYGEPDAPPVADLEPATREFVIAAQNGQQPAPVGAD